MYLVIRLYHAHPYSSEKRKLFNYTHVNVCQISKWPNFKKISYEFRNYKGDLDKKLHAGIFFNFEVLLKKLCLIDSLDKKVGQIKCSERSLAAEWKTIFFSMMSKFLKLLHLSFSVELSYLFAAWKWKWVIKDIPVRNLTSSQVSIFTVIVLGIYFGSLCDDKRKV